MPPTKNSATSAYLYLGSGVAFLAAGFLAHQVAFYGVGAAFIALGAAQYRRSKIDK